MTDLSSLVSHDSRSPIERLRRAQLWKIARKHGLHCASDAPKSQMIQLIAGSGIDVTAPDSGQPWRQIVQKDEGGGSHIELYPVVPEAKRRDVDYDEVIKKAASRTAQAEADTKAAQDRVSKLEHEMLALKALMSGPELPLEDMLPWQLQRIMEKRGIAFEKGMRKADMLRALEAK